MNPDQYTPDTVCRAMGIPRFADTGAFGDDEWAMRVVLRPSFTPEVCITLIDGSASVSTLYEMLWHQPFPCTLPGARQSFAVTAEQQIAIARACSNAVHEIRNEQRMVVICDGMRLDAAWYNEGAIEQIGTHVTGEEVENFIRTLIQLTYDAADNVLIRNNLANCGRYVDLELPIHKRMFGTTQKLNIAVIGTPDDRDDLIRRISPQRDA